MRIADVLRGRDFVERPSSTGAGAAATGEAARAAGLLGRAARIIDTADRKRAPAAAATAVTDNSNVARGIA